MLSKIKPCNKILSLIILWLIVLMEYVNIISIVLDGLNSHVEMYFHVMYVMKIIVIVVRIKHHYKYVVFVIDNLVFKILAHIVIKT